MSFIYFSHIILFFRKFTPPIILLVLILANGVATESDENDSDGVRNTIWASVDDRKVVLFSLNSAENYDKHTTRDEETIYDSDEEIHYTYTRGCKHHPAWTIIRNGVIVDDRTVSNLTINRMLTPEIPQYIFYHFCELKRLKITNQHLKAILPVDFEKSSHLRHLNLSHNDITRIRANVFENSYDLREIDLSFNQIEFIDDTAFQPERLYAIYLQHNKLSKVKWELFHPSSIRELILNDNNIVSIDSSVVLWGMIAFDISNNALKNSTHPILVHGMAIKARNTGIHTLILYPQTLKLDARDNQISKIILEEASSEFNVTSLNLRNNSLTSISNLSKLVNLEELDLTYNNFETLDATAVSQMTNLRNLSLSHNRLKHPFRFLLNALSLEYLDLSYNNFSHFRLTFNAPKLLELHLEGNNLTVLDTNIKRMAPELVRIGLSDNQWNCNQLTSSLLLVQFDGIAPVINATISDSGVSGRNYTGAVKGIECYDDGIYIDQRIGEGDVLLTRNAVNEMIDLKMDRMEANIEKMIGDLRLEFLAYLKNGTILSDKKN